jgi:hypothetical protein
MTPVAFLLLVQLRPLDQALEAGRKESKPVLCFVHRKDWGGEEKVGKGFSDLLGGLASKVVLAHKDVTGEEKLMEAWAMKRADSAFVVLDPFPAQPKNQPLGRFEEDEGKITPENVKKFLEEPLRRWDDAVASRAALDKLWGAMKKPDYDAFKAALWPAQVAELGEGKVKALFDGAVADLKRVDRIEHNAVDPREVHVKLKESDPTVEAMFQVRFVMILTDGKKDGTSMPVVRTPKGYFVQWVN